MISSEVGAIGTKDVNEEVRYYGQDTSCIVANVLFHMTHEVSFNDEQ